MTASSQPTSDSEHKTCSLLVMGFGAIPRILPGKHCLQIPLCQQGNPAIMAQEILPKHWPEVFGQPPHPSPWAAAHSSPYCSSQPARRQAQSCHLSLMQHSCKNREQLNARVLPSYHHLTILCLPLLLCVATKSTSKIRKVSPECTCTGKQGGLKILLFKAAWAGMISQHLLYSVQYQSAEPKVHGCLYNGTTLRIPRAWTELRWANTL